MIPIRQLARQKYSDDLYEIVESCLALDWLKRPQTAFELQKRLTESYPAAAGDSGNSIFDTISKPLSKLFSRKAENES
jgi:hypothetical protein